MIIRHLLSISDLSAEQMQSIIRVAQSLKSSDKNKPIVSTLAGKNMVMIFDKPSLRTRLSFEIGMLQLGGHAVYLAPDDIKLGVRETVPDTAKVVGSMADVIVARVSGDDVLRELAANSRVPVINAMTDAEHPCQVLADLLTIYEKFGTLGGIKVAYLGDANNNVTNSWAIAAETLGIQLTIASPEDYSLPSAMAERAPSVRLVRSPQEAVKGVQVVITDTWVSMGKEAQEAVRLTALAPYRVTKSLMRLADTSAIFLHCLPAHRGSEVTAEVIDGPQSAVFQEAENRLHAQKALLIDILG